MIFGRKKNKDVADEQTVIEEQRADAPEPADRTDGPGAEQGDDAGTGSRPDGGAEGPGGDEVDEGAVAQAYRANLEREDGPFDIDEVDLDADDVTRIDFDSLIVTPFENMQMQLQLDQETGSVHSLLVVQGTSALEVALFAAPASSLMVDEVHEEMVRGTKSQGGDATVGPGPLGAELRRIVPMKGPDGEDGYHISRTWLAQGPRWLLRGVLMGEAALGDELDATGELLYEFFCNLVVRRDNSPRVPGDVIGLKVPEELRPEEA